MLSFKTSNPKTIPQVVVILLFLICFFITIHYPFIAHQFPLLVLILLGAFFLTLILLAQYVVDTTIIELYNDKLVIKGKNANTILLADIRNFSRTYSRNSLTIKIKLNDGSRLQISGMAYEIRPLLDAFEANIQQLITTKHLPIKRVKDWSTYFQAYIVVLVCLLVILYLVMHQYGNF